MRRVSYPVIRQSWKTDNSRVKMGPFGWLYIVRICHFLSLPSFKGIWPLLALSPPIFPPPSFTNFFCRMRAIAFLSLLGAALALPTPKISAVKKPGRYRRPHCRDVVTNEVDTSASSPTTSTPKDNIWSSPPMMRLPVSLPSFTTRRHST